MMKIARKFLYCTFSATVFSIMMIPKVGLAGTVQRTLSGGTSILSCTNTGGRSTATYRLITSNGGQLFFLNLFADWQGKTFPTPVVRVIL